jgi:hypothetical protein
MTEEGDKGEGGRNLFTRLADAGEEAIQRVGDMPGVGKLAEPVMALRERVDDLQRRVRGLDALERRLAELEQRVARLEGSGSGAGTAGTRADVLADSAASTQAAGAPMPPTPGSATAVPGDDPTAGTAGAEDTGTSSQAP